MVIRRKVIEELMQQFGGPFSTPIDGRGRMTMSDDITFCRRSRKAGLRVFADFDRPADHHPSSGITLFPEVFGAVGEDRRAAHRVVQDDYRKLRGLWRSQDEYFRARAVDVGSLARAMEVGAVARAMGAGALGSASKPAVR